MIRKINDATIVNKGRKERKKKNMEIKKPYAVVQYNKFIRGVYSADQYLSYYSVLQKTVKWSKKVVLAKLCALQCIFCVQDTKYKVQELSARGRKVLDIRSPESKWVKFWRPSIAGGGGLNRSRQADSLVISEYTNLNKFLVMGREKGSILQDSVKCVLHIRSEVRRDTFVNSVLFRSQRVLFWEVPFSDELLRLPTGSFYSHGLRSIIYSFKT